MRTIALVMIFAATIGIAAAADEGMIRKQSAHSVEDTAQRFEAAVREKGMVVFPRYDHAQAAREQGLEMRPTVVLAFGAPKYGTPIMKKNPLAAIDFPPKALVYEDSDGTVWIAYNSAEYFYGTIFGRHGLDYSAEDVEKLGKALDGLTARAVRSGS